MKSYWQKSCCILAGKKLVTEALQVRKEHAGNYSKLSEQFKAYKSMKLKISGSVYCPVKSLMTTVVANPSLSFLNWKSQSIQQALDVCDDDCHNQHRVCTQGFCWPWRVITRSGVSVLRMLEHHPQTPEECNCNSYYIVATINHTKVLCINAQPTC